MAEAVAPDAPTEAVSRLAPDHSLRPQLRGSQVPVTRWRHRPEAALWTRAMLSALRGHARPLVEVVPRDVAEWCPAYADNPPEARAAFWAGLASALAKHESTYDPRAVGGGGKWYGLLQILPATARWRGCRAGSGPALTGGAANLSCALRIMAITVPRDRAIALRDTRWRGVAADWGPMRSPSKRRDMANWLKQQSYCQPIHVQRPRLRPAVWPPQG
ncbi:MAG: lytic transglycosylase [Rhodobacteraceae bacterium]|nr:MAG: lytic transglycosylase [Paracoccaceae bacterium]